MADNFLNKTGVLLLWNKIKSDFANASHTHAKANISDFSHAASHLPGGGDALDLSALGVAMHLSGTFSLTTSGWTASGTLFYKDITATGLTGAADEHPHIDRITGTDVNAAKLINEAWALIAGCPVNPYSMANKIRIYATAKPTTNITGWWEVDR